MKRLVLGIALLQSIISANDNYIGKYLCNEQQVVIITKYDLQISNSIFKHKQFKHNRTGKMMDVYIK